MFCLVLHITLSLIIQENSWVDILRQTQCVCLLCKFPDHAFEPLPFETTGSFIPKNQTHSVTERKLLMLLKQQQGYNLRKFLTYKVLASAHLGPGKLLLHNCNIFLFLKSLPLTCVHDKKLKLEWPSFLVSRIKVM